MHRQSHNSMPPSEWVIRYAKYIQNHGVVLDLACGAGRHTRYMLGLSHPVVAIDIDISKLSDISDIRNLYILEYNLEESAWPLGDKEFAGIIVTNYLHRPLIPSILGSLADKGILIYETFAVGNETLGKPKNPDYLLKHEELLDFCIGQLRVIAYENLTIKKPKPAVVQRICAINN